MPAGIINGREGKSHDCERRQAILQHYLDLKPEAVLWVGTNSMLQCPPLLRLPNPRVTEVDDRPARIPSLERYYH